MTFQLLERSPRRKKFHQRVQAARLNEKSQFVQSMETLWTMLESMLGESKQVCGILDGLDECNKSPTELVPFLHRLTGIFKAEGRGAKLMVISRLDQLNTGEDLALWNRVQIHSSDVRQDIERIASIRVESSRVLRKHPEKKDILQALVDGSDGMILWTELMIKELEAGHWNVQRVLQNPPRGLSEVYTAILHRVSAKKGLLAKIQHVLHLILAAARPLHFKELALGLAVADGLRCHDDYDLRGDPITESQEIVLESSPLLMMMPDGTVQLAHTSLKEYLYSPEAPSSSAVFRFHLYDVHSEMASILISYLSFQCFTGDLTEQLQSKHHFLEYASLWLVHHATRAEDSRQTVEKLVSFFSITQGWKWAERLSTGYYISHGHLQLMQSELKLWAQALEVDGRSWDILSSFLLVLARNRYKEMKSLPKDHPSVVQVISNLASTFWNQGRWKEAEELNVQVMETSSRVLGQEHPDTLSSMANLAATYRNQGRWKEAEELEVQVMETSSRVLGQEHPDTLSSMANLAATYRNQGRWKEAELEVPVMETSSRVLGQEHPDTLSSMANLAATYRNQGRWKEAKELNVQVMKTRKRVLGQEHPDMLLSMTNLAYIWKSQGREEEAIGLMKQVETL